MIPGFNYQQEVVYGQEVTYNENSDDEEESDEQDIIDFDSSEQADGALRLRFDM